jgi:hypothetical protein
MKTTSLIASLTGLALLSACGSKTDANEKNFGAALTQYFEKKGDLCLGMTKWPVDVTEADQLAKKSWPGGVADRMAALETLGLVKAEDAEVGTGAKAKVRRYALTDAAKPFVHEREAVRVVGMGSSEKTKLTDLCWGKKTLDKVVKWEGPLKLGDYQEASVTYTYKIDQLADWAKKPEFQAAFIGAKEMINAAGSKESRHGVKLTSAGWEAKGLD